MQLIEEIVAVILFFLTITMLVIAIVNIFREVFSKPEEKIVDWIDLLRNEMNAVEYYLRKAEGVLNVVMKEPLVKELLRKDPEFAKTIGKIEEYCSKILKCLEEIYK